MFCTKVGRIAHSSETESHRQHEEGLGLDRVAVLQRKTAPSHAPAHAMAHTECGERTRQPRRDKSYDRRSKSYTATAAAAATTDAEKGSASTEPDTATFRQSARKRTKAFTQAPNTLGQIGVCDSSTGGICSSNSSNQRSLVTSGAAFTKWPNRQQLYPPQFP